MRNCSVKFGIILILIIIFTGSAHAWSWNDLFGINENNVSEKLKEIELKAESWNQNQRMMKFLNRNMFDKGVDTVEISIINDNQILKTYYIVKAQDMKGTASLAESILGNPGVIWKFKPTVKQSLDGFDQASNALSILEQEDKSKLKVAATVMKALYLYYSVDSENVPALSELIKNSSCKQCKKVLSWAGKI